MWFGLRRITKSDVPMLKTTLVAEREQSISAKWLRAYSGKMVRDLRGEIRVTTVWNTISNTTSLHLKHYPHIVQNAPKMPSQCL